VRGIKRLVLGTSGVLAVVFCSAASAQSSYAGQEQRHLKAYSDQEIADLKAGKGMGFAKTAELNGYPGPAHVMAHAEALGLSAEQRDATLRLMEAHRARASALGAELLDAEQALEAAFASHTVDEARLATLTQEVGRRQAALRAEHLGTHLKQTQLLSSEQVARYQTLQGYMGNGVDNAGSSSASHHHH